MQVQGPCLGVSLRLGPQVPLSPGGHVRDAGRRDAVEKGDVLFGRRGGGGGGGGAALQLGPGPGLHHLDAADGDHVVGHQARLVLRVQRQVAEHVVHGAGGTTTTSTSCTVTTTTTTHGGVEGRGVRVMPKTGPKAGPEAECGVAAEPGGGAESGAGYGGSETRGGARAGRDAKGRRVQKSIGVRQPLAWSSRSLLQREVEDLE